MQPAAHAAVALAIALPLRRAGWSPPSLALFCAGGVLLDADRFLFHAVRTGDWSPAGAFRSYRRRAESRPRRARVPFRWRRPNVWGGADRQFHALPVLAVLALAALRWRPLLPFAWGALVHWLVDYADACTKADNHPGNPGVPGVPGDSGERTRVAPPP